MRATSGSAAAATCPPVSASAPRPSTPARSGAATTGSLGDGDGIAQGIAMAVTHSRTRGRAPMFHGAGMPSEPLLTPLCGIGRGRPAARTPRRAHRRLCPGHRAAVRPAERAGAPPRARRLHHGADAGDLATVDREDRPALDIAERDWPGIVADQTAATARWARHIADPTDVETYVFLRSHTRHGFIAQFPASRFIASQMRLRPAPRRSALRASVRGRRRAVRAARRAPRPGDHACASCTSPTSSSRDAEELLLEQEASYRRAIDHAPACILRTDTRRAVASSTRTHVAERLLGCRARRARSAAASSICCHPASGPRGDSPFGGGARARHGAARRPPPRWCRTASSSPSTSSAGAIDYGNRHWVQLICIDMSEQRRLESPARPVREDGGDRPARGRHRPRAPQPARHRDERALRPPRPILGRERRRGRSRTCASPRRRSAGAQAIIKNLLEFSRESGAELERLDMNDLSRRTLQLARRSTCESSGVARRPPTSATSRLRRQRRTRFARSC
mgnify:CR=1 FL=1